MHGALCLKPSFFQLPRAVRIHDVSGLQPQYTYDPIVCLSGSLLTAVAIKFRQIEGLFFCCAGTHTDHQLCHTTEGLLDVADAAQDHGGEGAAGGHLCLNGFGAALGLLPEG